MVQFKIELEEAVVQSFGHAQVEKYLKDLVTQLHLKIAAKEILNDLQAFDLTNDPEWQAARNLAWQQEKHHYLMPQA